ncbi:hypothetical protein ACFX12_028289 [Malus domestica]
MKKRVRPNFQFVRFKKAYLFNLEARRQTETGKKNLGKNGRNRGTDYNLVDRISWLPDEVLVSILSRLPLKEAAATSILSRQWRYVWVSTMTLVFDSEFDIYPFHRLYEIKPELRDQETRRYVDWVNHVVEHHTGTTIERFRACFHLDYRYSSSIDKWIHIARKKQVQILELDFHVRARENYYTFSEELLGIDQASASKLTHSYPEIPSARFCGYNTGFKFLKALCVCKVSVSREILEYFLSNCPLLERLTVRYTTKKLVNLRVVGPSIALKYLVIESCPGLHSIEISGVNLVSFSYCGTAINLLLSKLPFLVEVSISEEPVKNSSDHRHRVWGIHYLVSHRSVVLPFTQLSCCLAQLEILEVDIVGAVYNDSYTFPILANLKHLKLLIGANYYRDLDHLSSFMKACPYLKRLVLKVNRPTCGERKEIAKVAKCPHNYLKVVEIVGYRAHACVIQHVMFLMESIVELEKIVIDPVRHWCWPRGTDGGREEPDLEAKAREHAVQHLKQRVPSTVEFVCL